MQSSCNISCNKPLGSLEIFECALPCFERLGFEALEIRTRLLASMRSDVLQRQVWLLVALRTLF